VHTAALDVYGRCTPFNLYILKLCDTGLVTRRQKLKEPEERRKINIMKKPNFFAE